MKKPISLIGDIGGTNIRLAVHTASDDLISCIKTYRCADFPHLDDALKHYLEHGARLEINSISALCLAVPGSTHEDTIVLPNSHWVVERQKLHTFFSCPVFLINDFTAQALSISSLNDNEIKWLQNSKNKNLVENNSSLTTLIMGPGTGLGVAGLLPDGKVIESEGGHVSFAPVTDIQIEILNVLSKKYSRVSVERLLSGPGIANLYTALQQIQASQTDLKLKENCVSISRNTDTAEEDFLKADILIAETLTAEKISALALQGDELSLKTICEFSRILGSTCGDQALSFGALGGVYLSGGILNKLGDLFNVEEFLAYFNSKGRYESYCRSIPIAMITAPQPGLMGAANFLKSQLQFEPQFQP